MRRFRKTTSILAVSIASFSNASCSNVERGGISSGGDHPNPDGTKKAKSSSGQEPNSSEGGIFGGVNSSSSTGTESFHRIFEADPNGSAPVPICQTPVPGGSCSIYADAVIIKIGTTFPESKQIIFTPKLKSSTDVTSLMVKTGKQEIAPISTVDTPWCQYKHAVNFVWQVTTLSGDLAEFVAANCGPKATQ